MPLTPQQRKDLFAKRLAAAREDTEKRKDRVYNNILSKIDAQIPALALKRKIIRLLDTQIKEAVQGEQDRCAQLILDMGIENAGEIVSMMKSGGKRPLRPGPAANERLGS